MDYIEEIFKFSNPKENSNSSNSSFQNRILIYKKIKIFDEKEFENGKHKQKIPTKSRMKRK